MSHENRLRRLLPLFLLLICLPVFLYAAAGALSGRARAQALALTERSVRRAALQCYALEGAYPTSLGALTERYGVTVDQSRYFVDYRYVASNLMPEITVLPRS